MNFKAFFMKPRFVFCCFFSLTTSFAALLTVSRILTYYKLKILKYVNKCSVK